MDDAALAAAEHENMLVSFGMVAARVPGGLHRRRGGVVTSLTRAPLPLFNQIAVDSSGDVGDALGREIDVMQAEDVPFIVLLREGTDDRCIPVVERADLHALGGRSLPGMALHPIEAQALPPAELEIRRVMDPSGIDEHLAVNAAASGVPPSILGFLGDIGLERVPEATILLGLVDGRAVTTAMGYRTGGVIGVYSVATLPDARRRGYGAAITGEILRAGRAGGCDVAILQSSEMGQQVYEALGFRTVVRYRTYGPVGRGEGAEG